MTARLIGNLRALDVWYETVRMPAADGYHKPLYDAARKQALAHAAERAKRLSKILGKLERSIAKAERQDDEGLRTCAADHRHMLENAAAIEATLAKAPEHDGPPKAFLNSYGAARAGAAHIDAVRAVSAAAAKGAAKWLAGLAGQAEANLSALLPARR